MSQARIFLQITHQVRTVLENASQIPELKEDFRALRVLENELSLLVNSRGRHLESFIEVGSEPASTIDLVSEETSDINRLRRTQAKKIARYLYSTYHDDGMGSNRQPWLKFSDIRDLANNGEIEILQALRAGHASLDRGDEEMFKQILGKVQVRTAKLSGSKPFKLSRLFFSNPDQFVSNVKLALQSKSSVLLAMKASLLVNQNDPHQQG